jgi:hypothetical protein
MINKIFKDVDQALLKRVTETLKIEYKNGHKDILNTEEKLEHVLDTLDKIGSKKYDFVKKNVEEGEKIN